MFSEITVGADLRVCPINTMNNTKGEHIGSPLHVVIQWFKTMTTNEYIRGVKPMIGDDSIKNYGKGIIGNILFVMKMNINASL